MDEIKFYTEKVIVCLSKISMYINFTDKDGNDLIATLYNIYSDGNRIDIVDHDFKFVYRLDLINVGLIVITKFVTNKGIGYFENHSILDTTIGGMHKPIFEFIKRL